MSTAINMPQVGQDIETGTIVEWCVKEGDQVNKGDVIAMVESDKATFEVEAYESGVMLKILYEAGAEAKVLEPIAYIGQAGEIIEVEAPAGAAVEVAVAAGSSVAQRGPATTKDKVSVSPSAKRVAKEHNVDLSKVKGSGPGGRVQKEDVLAYIEASKVKGQPAVAPVQQGDREIPFSKIRQRTADRLAQSKQTIPHFYLFVDVDMSAAVKWRVQYNQKPNVKITFNDMIVKAAATALTEFPQLNAHVAADKLIIKKQINVGIAVAIDDGLIVPVIADADKKTIEQISTAAKENIEGTKKGVLKSQSVGTFTVSNLGMHKIGGFLPIINPPECAILGVGNIEKRAVAVAEETVGVRDMMTLSIVSDHRGTSGAGAAAFLNSIKNQLENFSL